MKEFMWEVVFESFKVVWEAIKREILPLIFVGIFCAINLSVLVFLYDKGIITDLLKVATLQSVFATVLAYRVGKSVGEEE